MAKLLNKILKKITKNHTQIPLFFVDFNFQKYKEQGEKDSCMVYYHPDFTNDEELKQLIFDAIDHIRENYDMEQFTKL